MEFTELDIKVLLNIFMLCANYKSVIGLLLERHIKCS